MRWQKDLQDRAIAAGVSLCQKRLVFFLAQQAPLFLGDRRRDELAGRIGANVTRLMQESEEGLDSVGLAVARGWLEAPAVQLGYEVLRAER